MGLSDDQRAMLRLLAQREQGYDDIAALMGISVEEVRARVGEALSQLEDEGAEVPDVPRASATEPKPDPAAEPEAAAPPPAAPPDAAPLPAEPPGREEEQPAPPQEPAAGPAATAPPPAGERARPRLRFPSDPTARAAIAAGVLIVALLLVILVINGTSGESGADTTSTSGAQASAEGGSGNQAAANSSSKRLTKAVLEPVDGSEAAGVAVFGRVGKKLALQVEATGLEPTTKGTSYTLWLAQSPQRMLPLAETAVPKSGRIGAQFEVPVELLAYLANETFDQFVLTRTDDARLKASLEAATKAKRTPSYTGTAVLSGQITGPIVGLAKRVQSE